MHQFRLIEPQQASPEARKALEGIQNQLGRIPNMFKVMANSSAVLKGFLGFNDALAAGQLSAKLREQVALTVAQRNHCQYCLAAHVAIGKSVGLSDEEIEMSRRGESTDKATSAALTFVTTLVDQKGAVSEADVASLRQLGFDEGQIAELIAATVLSVLTNYFNLATRVPIDFPLAQPLAEVV